MTHYIIYFNQQWVGDHSEEWFQSRGQLVRAVVAEMKEAGVLIFAAGVDEDLSKAFSANNISGELQFSEGRYSSAPEYLGGFTVVDVSKQESAKFWAGKLAIACGWPQEVRPLHV
jgi:hypothetical protein